MSKKNPFINNSFSDLWAKAEYLQQLAMTGEEKGLMDVGTTKAVNGIVGDLYDSMEKKFGDPRLKKVIGFAFQEPSRIVS